MSYMAERGILLESARQAIVVGALWLVMTLMFEFGFGHWVAGRTWPTLFNEYNLLAGRVWVFIPAWLARAPTIFFRLQK